MSNLNALKNRISVVGNTKKITKAMQLVATAKLQKTKKDLENIKNYRNLLEETFNELMQNVSQKDLQNIFPANENLDQDLYIIISSDLGLCGSYNSNIYAQIHQNVTDKDLVIFVGAKAYLYAHSFIKKENIVQKYFAYGDSFNYALAESISKDALELYFNKKIRSIKIIYTEFVNNIIQEAKTFQLFPFVVTQKVNVLTSNVEFYPNAETILRNSIPLFIGSMIYSLGNFSKISEMSSRRNAMENATENANELIHELGLEFNRKRQSLITQEITEIVSGADATQK
ncbi:ATP synthase F1 subunit gamma [Mycoplasmopsis columboralis]|uniref:ATP synthase gamma chain n=1 Tax=Mycoplasmopsis columboralis TaxID=171282 RepID=A0A449B7K4_9BACT|nr:ATP synthase F1 subunit gamma [Mycoplasmopsis columboralis]VEU76556.1 ATP synthase F1, gamma subunit [Mycoplasmopsis columboralis]